MSNEVKLHLGCGKRFIPGFIHIDAMEHPHVDYVQDISDLSNFSDESVDLVYACHVLEHFKRDDTQRILNEWARVLKLKGTIRLSVPDFESICEIYQTHKDISLIEGPVVGGQTNIYNFHYTVFDFKKIKNLLKNAGFSNIRRYDWRNTSHKLVDDYSQAYIPHMDKTNGKLISLNVEAERVFK
tara:strand:- start:349 stop:900 length:552 start_codon:yes stop_codon:yes gene_type:complete